MKKIILSVALVSLSLSSCKKKTIEPTPQMSECEKNQTGTLKVVNTTPYLQYVYIDNVYVVKVDPLSVANYTTSTIQTGFPVEVKIINTNDFSSKKQTVTVLTCNTTEIDL